MQRLFGPLLAIAVLAWLCIRLEALGVLAAIRSAVRKMSAFQRFAAAASLAVLIAFAGDKTNSPPMNLPPLPPIFPPVLNPPLPALTSGSPSDTGFVIVGEEIASCAIVPPPAGAVTQETWRLRGAHEDHARIPSVPGWSMLTPSGRVDSLDVLASGGFGVSPCDSFYPPPFADGLSLAPAANWNALAGEERASIFWHALTPSNSLLATWQDALLGRSATNIVSFQAEFQPGGGFEYRYGDRCVSYSPVPPFDLDGDGLENSVDPDPLVPGSDAHGTNVEWHNIVCSNVLAAVEGQGGVELSWLEGVNSNAYFFAEVVADIGPAAVYFTCDTETGLGNPVVVALAGETNRVPLLVGVGYSVSSDVPFSVSVPDGATAVSNGVSVFRVERPVSFEFVQDANALATGVVAYAVLVDPPGLEGAFAWESNGQPLPQRGGIAPLRAPPMRSGSGGGCSFVGFGNYVIFTCGESCDCGGCEAVGSYTYENVYMPVSGGPCGCTPHDDPPEDPDDPTSGGGGDPPDDPDPPQPSVSLSSHSSTVMFENTYTNSPGNVVPMQKVGTLFECHYNTGENAGLVSLEIQGGGNTFRLHEGNDTGPVILTSWSTEVAADSSGYNVFYVEPLEKSSSVGEIRIKATLTDGDVTLDDTLELTSVRFSVEALAFFPSNRVRHVFGPNEDVRIRIEPNVPSLVLTGSLPAGGSFDYNSGNGLLRMPYRQDTFSFLLSGDCGTLQIPFSVIEPNAAFQAHDACYPNDDIWGEDIGRPEFTVGEIGAAFHVGIRLLPNHVSFSKLTVEEQFAVATDIQGLFTNSVFNGYLDHAEGAGAEKSIDVTEENEVGDGDTVFFALNSSFLPNLEYGSYRLDIPVIWYIRNTQITNQMATVTMRNIVMPSADVTISKHGISETRGTNNVHTITQ